MHDFVLTALGKDNFCSDQQIRTHPQRTVTWAGKEVQEVRATAYLRNGSKAAGFRRSGTNGVFLNLAERDEATVVVPLPLRTTLTQARAVNSALTVEVGLGVVLTPRGYGIRCMPEHKQLVNAKATPEEAQAYGELFALTKDDARTFMIKGVDDMVRGPALHSSLRRNVGLGH